MPYYIFYVEAHRLYCAVGGLTTVLWTYKFLADTRISLSVPGLKAKIRPNGNDRRDSRNRLPV